MLYYLNGFVNSFSIVYNPGINADMRDYQQYRTGERIDGMFGAVGIIGSFIGMFTGLVLPAIYQSLGLQDNYDVLEVASFREDMFEALIIAAVIGAFLNMVPYFFYDLTEIKQKGIIKVLKIRAMFEDYGNGILKDEDLVEAIDIIDEANRLYTQRVHMTTKDDINNAKKLPARTEEEKTFRKSEIERLKKAYKEFNSEQKNKIKENLAAAKAMPKSTKEEKAARKEALKKSKAENKALRNLNKDISVCNFVIDEMNKYAFLKCKNAKEVIIPGSCKAIEDSAFYQCTGIEALTLAEGIEVIGKGSFEECTALKAVTVPESVRTIEKYAFYNCTALEECVIGNPKIMENDIFTNDKTVKIIAESKSAAEKYAKDNNIKTETP